MNFLLKKQALKGLLKVIGIQKDLFPNSDI